VDHFIKSLASATNPEKQVLLPCVRTRMSTELTGRIRTLISGGLDWEAPVRGSGRVAE
jgi:hypothetical protein